jgi:hypothetical protein
MELLPPIDVTSTKVEPNEYIDIETTKYVKYYIKISPYPSDTEVAGDDEKTKISVAISKTIIGLTSSSVSQSRDTLKKTTRAGERELVRSRLLNAGFLVTSIPISVDEQDRVLSPQEIEDMVKLPPNAPTILELLDEDRGEY